MHKNKSKKCVRVHACVTERERERGGEIKREKRYNNWTDMYTQEILLLVI